VQEECVGRRVQEECGRRSVGGGVWEEECGRRVQEECGRGSVGGVWEEECVRRSVRGMCWDNEVCCAKVAKGAAHNNVILYLHHTPWHTNQHGETPADHEHTKRLESDEEGGAARGGRRREGEGEGEGGREMEREKEKGRGELQWERW
jgi:hypothetical protein